MDASPVRRVPGRLSAPRPGWTTTADVVVIGSGIAGLTAALRLRDQVDSVMVVTKDVLAAGSTQWAQGGIAAALGPGDTPEEHELDTLVAGAGACDLEAVHVLVNEGPEAVHELIALGTNFDQTPAGELSLTREGGHHRDRIAHAGGDATGAEIQRALIAAVQAAPEIEVVQHALALDLLPAADGGVAGVTLHVMGEGQRDGVGAVLCRAVVLASGGLGQVFSQTTNPAVSTGDGMALALRAGAALRDLEFVQFHPTVMYLGPDSRGQQPLISEAVRGEGAFLVDGLPEAAAAASCRASTSSPTSRRATSWRRRSCGGCSRPAATHMWLDARHLGADFWERRFPTILATARSHGVDPVTELIPVAPACHYASGGVRTDLEGRTERAGPLRHRRGRLLRGARRQPARLQLAARGPGLLAPHRHRAARGAAAPGREPVTDVRTAGLVAGAVRRELQETMSSRVGVLRTADGLGEAAALLDKLAGVPADVVDLDSWETTNLLTISAALTDAAALREETRGSHWREDFPERDDADFAGHFDAVMSDGASTLAFVPAPATDGG